MTTMTFILSGSAAAGAGTKFGAMLRGFDPGADVTIMKPASLPDTARKAVDPIALATLILTIPSAVLTVMDIADRTAKRRRAQQMIDEAERLRREHDVDVFLLIADQPKPLATMTPDALLDYARDLQ